MNLDELRGHIDQADAELTAAFERRMKISRDIARYKIANHMQVLDPSREEKVILKAMDRVVSPDIRPYVRPLYETVMAASRGLQQQLIDESAPPEVREDEESPAAADGRPAVAFLGVPGSFSEEAVLAHFGDGCRPVAAGSFEDIFEGIRAGKWPMAMIPIENSLTGEVNANFDLLMDHDVFIIAERVLRVRHFLLGMPGVTLDRIGRVLSHPQALDQCRAYLLDHHMEAVPCQSTAGAARTVARQADPRVAAIASERAAGLYGLTVLARDIQNGHENFTRFVLISAEEGAPVAVNDKISLICVIDHTPGSLYHLLEIFARYGINLLKITSRPVPGAPWHYSFYVDIAGNLRDEAVGAALGEVEAKCSLMKLLGNYQSWRTNGQGA